MQEKVREVSIHFGVSRIGSTLSTFLGCAGFYLEELFVCPDFRGRGYGKTLQRHLAFQ